jgi:hypothetical protein
VSYFPDVVVEVAFDSGFATADADRTWTDVSAYVEADAGISIGFGRGDERSTADANTLSLTLDNTDGRFTAGLASGAYHPNVKIGRPIRVTATPDGGTASVRFVGYVDEWPVSWDGSDAHATATITATSRMARLGTADVRRRLYEEIVLKDAPVAYYPLTEGEGATSASDLRGTWPKLVRGGTGTAPAFGQDSGNPNGGTAVEFFGSKFLSGYVTDGSTETVRSIEFWMLPSATMAPGVNDSAIVAKANGLRLSTSYPSGYRIEVDGVDLGSMGAYTNGEAVYVAVSVPSGGGYPRLCDNGTVYTSGTSVSDVTAATIAAFVGSVFSGSVAHFAVYDYELTATQMEDHYYAGLSLLSGQDTLKERGDRLCTMFGLEDVTIDADTTTVAGVESDGRTPLDMLRDLETTGGGVLYDDRDGTLILRNRQARYAASTLTLNMAAQLVGSDFQPKLDRSSLVNLVDAEIEGALTIVRASDDTSRANYGTSAEALTTLNLDEEDLERRTEWILASYAEPQYRVPSLTVNLLDFDAAPSQNDVLGATIGTLVTVSNQPSQAADSSAAYFVEGYTETITGTSYDITFNVSPGSPTSDVLLLDTSGRNVLDTNVLAY